MSMHTSAAESPVHDQAPDAEVVAAVLAGDRAAFAILVRRHNQRLYRACRAVLGDDTEAEDAVQTAWVNVYRNLASFRGEARFSTWATRIAVNEASARLRQRRRLVAVSDEDVTMPDRRNPEDDATTRELGRLLERQLDELPEGMRAVLVLRDVLELDTAETASCLGIGEEAVRVRLHRARQAMARQMSGLVEQGGAAVWRFDGERCRRMVAEVMTAIGG
jgi:RNA polymerase sigma-70 factor (ECF subfamily)